MSNMRCLLLLAVAGSAAAQTPGSHLAAGMELERKLGQHLELGYAIESEKGGVGMSRTWIAEGEALNRKVVVKVIKGAAVASARRAHRCPCRGDGARTHGAAGQEAHVSMSGP